jgi:filamentous hemagglutinin family protein
MVVNVMSEFRNQTIKLNSRYKNRHRLGMSGYSQLFFYSFLFCYPSFSTAGPTGGSVVGGSGNIHLHGLTTEIHQTSSSLALEWNSFNINSNEIVNFVQPTSSSIALNQILSTRASDIRGQINANGQVVLVNPNGIFFGPTASVNVGGLIASGLNISTRDFMNGDYIFNEVLDTNGTVINSGIINISIGSRATFNSGFTSKINHA